MKKPKHFLKFWDYLFESKGGKLNGSKGQNCSKPTTIKI
jgi:hypothetical protein